VDNITINHKNTGVGKSRFTGVRMAKDMQVMIFTIVLLIIIITINNNNNNKTNKKTNIQIKNTIRNE
jgi:hypothetical protein